MLRLLSGVRCALLTLTLAVGLLLASATASWATTSCPNEQFRTGLGANLPDCRAYEQVSPRDKNGGGVDDGLVLETEPGPEQSSPDGERVLFASQTAFAEVDPLTAPATSQYMATRSPSGWSTIGLDPRQDFPHGRLDPDGGNLDENLYQGFSEDLRYGYLDAIDPPLTPEAPEGHYNPYLRDTTLGGYTLLAALGPSGPPQGIGGYGEDIHAVYAGMSSGGKQVIFAANAALTPEAVEEKTNLYEWNEGKLELVSIYPNGEPDAGGYEDENEGETRPQNSSLKFGGDVEQSEQGVHWNLSGAISDDGRKAFWTGGGGLYYGNRRIFMHELVGGGARTVEISASQKTGAVPKAAPYAHYWTASSDGSLVYFTSCEQLTNDSTAVEGQCVEQHEVYPVGSNGQDLYQYNTVTGALTDITVDSSPGETADVQGVIGASKDGSYVYFVAEGVLAQGAVQGEYNVYAWHEGVTSLVTTLKAREESRMWDQGVSDRTARVSPDGRYLAFESVASLTGNANTPASPSECARENTIDSDYQIERMTEYGRYCSEVFLYDDNEHVLVCASCGPDGLRPTGNSIVPDVEPSLSGAIEGWENPTYQQRYLLDDGRVFFDSTAALVPQDTNGANDVYEYEPAGVGGCAGSKSCLSLVSGGMSALGSRFIDADGVGDNVFFVTDEKLVEGDGDEAADLYDARVGGGLESQSALPCSGEACKPAVSVAPSIYGAPTSEAFSGAGNPPVSPQVASTQAKKAKKQASKPKRKRKRKKTTSKRKKATKSGVRGSRARHGKGRGK